MSLSAELERFKDWASTTYPDGPRGGEWECDYPHWSDIWDAVTTFLTDSAERSWSEVEVEDLLYALARDNEFETVSREIAKRPQVLLRLAALSENGERDARWQIAEKLGDQTEYRDEAEKHLLRLGDDPDEYVSRRALLSLGRLGSQHAERLAERAWQTEHEHQRIAALHVLQAIASPKLSHYIDMAFDDGRQYLVYNANKIKGG